MAELEAEAVISAPGIVFILSFISSTISSVDLSRSLTSQKVRLMEAVSDWLVPVSIEDVLEPAII